MKTEELIEWLKGVMKYGTFVKDIFDNNDEKIAREIIKRLEELEELRQLVELYRKYNRPSRA